MLKAKLNIFLGHWHWHLYLYVYIIFFWWCVTCMQQLRHLTSPRGDRIVPYDPISATHQVSRNDFRTKHQVYRRIFFIENIYTAALLLFIYTEASSYHLFQFLLRLFSWEVSLLF